MLYREEKASAESHRALSLILRTTITLLVLSAAIFAFSCSGGGGSDGQLLPTTLVGTMNVGDSAGTITMSFLSSSTGKAAAGGLQSVSGTFNFLDAAGNPVTIALSGTYNDGTGAVQVTGEGDFTAVGPAANIKRYIVKASGTYLDGTFTGTVGFTEKATSTLIVSGSAAARPTASQTPAAPAAYKMSSGDWKATAILSSDGTFQWTAEDSATGAMQFVYGIFVDSAGTKIFTPQGGRILDDSGADANVDLRQYRAALNAAGTSLTVYSNPGMTTVYMTFATQKVLEVVHIYTGTFEADDHSYSGTQRLKLYSDGKAECTWSATTGSASIGPGAGTYTLVAGNLDGSFHGLGNFTGSLEQYALVITGTVTAAGGSYTITSSAASSGTWTITKLVL
jgi:hypothetical protein